MRRPRGCYWLITSAGRQAMRQVARPAAVRNTLWGTRRRRGVHCVIDSKKETALRRCAAVEMPSPGKGTTISDKINDNSRQKSLFVDRKKHQATRRRRRQRIKDETPKAAGNQRRDAKGGRESRARRRRRPFG